VDMLLFQPQQSHSDERTFAEAARGEQEDFLSVGQIADELGELGGTVHKMEIVDNFAEDERIFESGHITLISVTLIGVKGKTGYVLWRNAVRRKTKVLKVEIAGHGLDGFIGRKNPVGVAGRWLFHAQDAKNLKFLGLLLKSRESNE